MILKWTHIEFGGGATSGPVKTLSGRPYPVFFQNPLGIFVLEDSWIYGSVDDPFRILGGKIAVLRNTFEKAGYQGGEAMNAKAGTIGDFAYNLCVGIATNGPKLSNSGVIAGVPGSNVRMYNNTIINCGYRRLAAGRGGSINFEEGAAGMAYNNLIVNCRFGLRITSDADVQNVKYNNQYYYGSSAGIVGQFLAADGIAKFQSGDIYSATAKDNDPQFYGYDLNRFDFVANPGPITVSKQPPYLVTVGAANFRLQAASKGLGKGNTNFTQDSGAKEITVLP